MTTTKRAVVDAMYRDENGDHTHTLSHEGTTTDDGATVTVGLGYFPGIENLPVADLKVTVHPNPTEKVPTAFNGRTENAEENTQVLSFTLPS